MAEFDSGLGLLELFGIYATAGLLGPIALPLMLLGGGAAFLLF